MNGQDFLRLTDKAFAPFLNALNFKADTPAISGKFYRASFNSRSHSVLISYEPGEEMFFIGVFTIRNGMLSEIDDLTESPRLADLNRRYMASVTSEERLKNEEFFRGIVTGDDDERMLLKMAKELRLVLPIYLNDSGYAGGN